MGNVERAVRDNNQTATTGRVMTRSASDVGGNLSHRGLLMRGRRFTGITASLRGVAGHNSTLMAPASRQRQSGCTHMRVLGSPPGDVQERRCSQAQVNDSKRRAHAASTRSAQPQSTLPCSLQQAGQVRPADQPLPGSSVYRVHARKSSLSSLGHTLESGMSARMARPATARTTQVVAGFAAQQAT